MNGFQQFKSEFLSWANSLLETWARENRVTKPSVHVIPDEQLDPWDYAARYVHPDWRYSGVTGPAIVFPENYLKYMYEEAVKRNRFPELWNMLKWKLAHEMGHHLSLFVPASKIADLLTGSLAAIAEALRRMELSASRYAFLLTGKTRPKHDLDFVAVTGKHPLRYAAEMKQLRRRRI